MRAFLAFLLATSVTCIAGEKVRFFETWEPRPALRDLWLPMRESWWNADLGFGTPRVATHFKNFARHHSPGEIVPEIFADTKIHHSELTEIAYTYLLAQWPRKKVLRLLQPYRHSPDPEVKRLAESFHDDLLQWETEQT
jgi:hypothetical protein